MRQIFILSKLFKDAYHLHLNVLGRFLYMKYDFLRQELSKFDVHIKVDAQYLVPVNGLVWKYSTLNCYIDALCKIPFIDNHLHEIMTMLEYASDPQPIRERPPLSA